MKTEKKTKVLSLRVSPRLYETVHLLVKEKHISASTLGRVLLEMYVRQEVKI